MNKDEVEQTIKENPITIDELRQWCTGTFSDWTEEHLLGILNGEYALEDAREDVLSFRKEELNKEVL